jgi:peroxiredoxin
MKGTARLKSYFVIPAATISALFVLLSLGYIVAGGHDRFAWWGVLIANAALPAYFAWLFRGRTARTSEYLPFLLLVSGAGLVISIWEVYFEGAARWPVLLPSTAGTALLAIYVFWYSRFDRRPSASLEVGKKMPSFELASSDGAIFRSAELDGSPAVLVFYRGNWCPFCRAQVRELASRYDEFEKLGAALVFISPQSAERSKALAAQFGPGMRFLVDESNRIADRFGIASRHGVPVGLPGGYAADTVMPTVVALNSSGTIVYSDQADNYRIRPEPDVYISILRRAGAILQ